MRSPPRLGLHRAVLALHPKRFRRLHGPAILRLTARGMGRVRRRGRRPGRVWATTLLDLVGNLVPAWLDSLRRRDASAAPHDHGNGRWHVKRGLIGTSLKRTLRAMRRQPGFAAAAMITIGVSVGATGGVFALIQAALLEPLPYDAPEQLVLITETRSGEEISVAYLNYLDWRASSTRISDMGGFVRRSATLIGEGPAEQLLGIALTSSAFDVLAVPPALGRVLSPAADLEGGPLEAVLSHGLWTRAFGEDPDIVGRTIQLDGEPRTVVGVMPPGFDFPEGIPSSIYLSVGDLVAGWQDRGSHPGLSVVARVATSSSVEGARAEMTDIAARLAELHPENEDESVYVRPVTDDLRGSLPGALLLLSIAGGLVLLIGIGNAVGLFLARALGTAGDRSVARALGAARGDLTLEHVVEGLLHGLGAGLLAVLVAYGILEVFSADLTRFPLLEGTPLGPTTVAYCLVGATLVATFAVLLPHVRGLVGAPPPILSDRGTVSASVGGRRLRTLLVGAQVALAVALVGGSGVLLRSFSAMSDDGGGIRAESVLVFATRLPASEEDRALGYYEALHEAIRGLPGVDHVGGISTLPFSGAGAQSGILPRGLELESDRGHRTDVNVVFDDYFEAMGVDLLAGRVFGPGDVAGAPTVVIVDERFANRFWPDEGAVGKTIDGWGLEGARIVGVVRHVKNYGVTATSREELYMPHRQRPYIAMYTVVASEVDPATLAEPVRLAAMAVDPNVPLTRLSPMANVVARTTSTPRLAARLGSSMAILAGLLACLGAYALIAHSVSQRRRELGLRMALGARQKSVESLVMGQGVRIATVGVAGGLAAMAAGSRVLEGFVYGVSPRDPVSLAVAVGGVVMLVLLAAWIPARRAASIDPITALATD